MKAILFALNTILSGGCAAAFGVWFSDHFLQPSVELALGGQNYIIAGIAIGISLLCMCCLTIANFLAFVYAE